MTDNEKVEKELRTYIQNQRKLGGSLECPSCGDPVPNVETQIRSHTANCKYLREDVLGEKK